MNLDLFQPDSVQKTGSSATENKFGSQEIISLKECKQYVGEFQLSDQRIIEIRNNMIGIIDQVINAYLRNVG
ncbi:MAG TPA: hypothetical protein VGE59_00950 [Patescibacteria group bacterium]